MEKNYHIQKISDILKQHGYLISGAEIIYDTNNRNNIQPDIIKLSIILENSLVSNI